MIHEEICTYEVCKLAKEKGFNEKCYHYYQNGVLESDGCFNRYNKGADNVCSAPTQSLLQRWLREEKNIHISVEYEWVENFDGWTFWAYIKQVKDERVIDDAIKSGFNTYELASKMPLNTHLKI